MKKDLHRHKSTKQVLNQLFSEGQIHASSDEWLHAKLFAEKPVGLRLIWEYTHMMFLSITSEETLKRYTRELTKIAELHAFHDKVNSLPLSEQKVIIYLFRCAMGVDCCIEEFLNLLKQITATV